MSVKKALPATISCVLVLVALAARADDFWKHKSPQEWTADEAVQVLRDSPWARQETVAASLANCDSDADGGDEGCRSGRFRWPRFGARRRELPSSEFNLAVYLVRWDSAPEVAAAFARLDSLGARALSAFQSPPPRRPADCYVVTMNVVRPARGAGDPFAIREKSKDKNPVRLKTSRGIFIPIETEHSGVGANEAVHFFFPREQDGKPVLDPAGDTAEFVFEGAKVSLKCKFSLDERAVR
jgi:hypothetical protein